MSARKKVQPPKAQRAKGFGEYLEDVFKSPEDKAALQADIELVHALADDAGAHPETLGDVGDLIVGDEELLAGIDPDSSRSSPKKPQPPKKARQLSAEGLIARALTDLREGDVIEWNRRTYGRLRRAIFGRKAKR